MVSVQYEYLPVTLILLPESDSSLCMIMYPIFIFYSSTLICLFSCIFFFSYLLKVFFRGVTRYYHSHIEGNILALPMVCTSFSQDTCPVFFFLRFFLFVIFLFCFYVCMIALLFKFDNTFSEYFSLFVNTVILHIFYQTHCIVYFEYSANYTCYSFPSYPIWKKLH